MKIKVTEEIRSKLREWGIETLHRGIFYLPKSCRFEPPCSLKFSRIEHSLELGAFSYHVSGFSCAAKIGRYTSIAEQVEIGRQNHPTDWLSTSPFQYRREKLFDVGHSWENSEEYHKYVSPIVDKVSAKSRLKVTSIGNDVWIGHGAYIRAGVSIGNGAIVAARAVVVKDVPPYAVVAGNPATVKKFRVDEDLIPHLESLEWWDFAPWQLGEISFNTVDKAIDQIANLKQFQKPYRPKEVFLESMLT